MFTFLRRMLAALCVIPLLVLGAPAARAANSVTVYYRAPSSWATVNIHYAPTGGAWTTVPGVAMTASGCTGWYQRTVDLGTAAGMQAVFTNGSGTWDNNSGKNYALGTGVTTVNAGVVTANATSPCVTAPADTTAPSAPAGLTATARNTTVSLTWTASTDDVAVAGYQIVRGGTVLTSSTNAYTDRGLAAKTAYSYTVKAVDAAGNVSAASSAVSVTTGDAVPVTQGEMLGGDPRKDSIYFVLTARFYDGNTANDRAAASTSRPATRRTATRCSGATSRGWSTSSTTSRGWASPPSGSRRWC